MKNTIKKIHYLSWFLLLSILTFSCKKDETDDPAPVNPGELITTVKLIFTDTLGGSIDTVGFYDADGPGGNNPLIDSILLQSGVPYQLRLLLLDESRNPPLNISDEIEEEGDTHLFNFSSTLLNTTILDTDINGSPVGILNLVEATGSGTGTWRVQLRHYDSPSLKSSNSSSYETDVEIEFGVRVD